MEKFYKQDSSQYQVFILKMSLWYPGGGLKGASGNYEKNILQSVSLWCHSQITQNLEQKIFNNAIQDFLEFQEQCYKKSTFLTHLSISLKS